VRNWASRLLSAGITRNSTVEADNGALREFVEQLQSRVGVARSQRANSFITVVVKTAVVAA
jgi:hypothetical protein